MNRYPTGQQVKLLVYFTNRPLTDAELQTFLAAATAGTLPAGVGVSQTTVQIDYWINAPVTEVGAKQTISGGSITDFATGSYYGVVTTTVPGIITYSGYSLDISSNPVARMEPIVLAVDPA